MKRVFRKQILISISLVSIFLTTSMADSKLLWKKADLANNKKDCVNCYANLEFDKKSPKVVNKKKRVIYNNSGYTYTISRSDRNPKAIEFKDRTYIEKRPKSYINKSKTVAIQLGAFRHYAGAKKYLKKYAILSSEYKVIIKAGAEDQKPLYRVQIEGFPSRSKAEEFKSKYGLIGAFFVMN